MTKLVVDLSEHNGAIDWPRLRGVNGSIVKVNEGDYIDHRVAANLRGQRTRYRASILAGNYRRGAYDFLRPRPDRKGGDEARIFLNTIRSVLGSVPRDMLLVPDVEVDNGHPGLVFSYTIDWCDFVFEHALRRPLPYSYVSFFDQLVRGGDVTAKGHPLSTWVAGYGPQPSGASAAVRRMILWQFTNGESGPPPHSVPVIGACDISRPMVAWESFNRYGRRPIT